MKEDVFKSNKTHKTVIVKSIDLYFASFRLNSAKRHNEASKRSI